MLDDEGKRAFGLDHPRSGELVAMSDARRWFTYYFWLDDDRAPDYARTVDIHRKPGYDPVELFLDPGLTFPKLRIAARLRRRCSASAISWTSFRSTPRSCRARTAGRPTGPRTVRCSSRRCPQLLGTGPVAATDVKSLLLEHVFGAAR